MARKLTVEEAVIDARATIAQMLGVPITRIVFNLRPNGGTLVQGQPRRFFGVQSFTYQRTAAGEAFIFSRDPKDPGNARLMNELLSQVDNLVWALMDADKPRRNRALLEISTFLGPESEAVARELAHA